MKYKIISFYFDKSKLIQTYRKAYERFVSVLDRAGLDYYIENPKLSKELSYFEITKYKSEFVKNCMDNFDCPLIWIDIDSILKFKSKQQFEDFIIGLDKFDFSAVVFDSYSKMSSPYIFTGGFLYFNNTKKGKSLINKWIQYCNNSESKHGDHSRLIKAFKDSKGVSTYVQPINPKILDFVISRHVDKRNK
tara:strand:- start:3 stop:575 length:573 start_codon:yes stop_codon:yes gene_type:complete